MSQLHILPVLVPGALLAAPHVVRFLRRYVKLSGTVRVDIKFDHKRGQDEIEQTLVYLIVRGRATSLIISATFFVSLAISWREAAMPVPVRNGVAPLARAHEHEGLVEGS